MEQVIYNNGNDKKFVKSINEYLKKDFEVLFIDSRYAVITDSYKDEKNKIERICVLEMINKESFFNNINKYMSDGYGIDMGSKDFVQFDNGKWMTVLSKGKMIL